MLHSVPFLLAASLPALASVEDELPAPDPAITRAALEHHLRFLASDELLGREMATPESLRVSDYLARSLERSGVAPAGGAGSYFQEVPLLVTRHEGLPAARLVLEDGTTRELVHGVEFTVDVSGEARGTPALPVLLVREEDDVPPEPDPGRALVLDYSRRKGIGLLEDRGWERGAGFGLVVRAREGREGKTLGVPPRRVERAWTADSVDGQEILTVRGEPGELLWTGRVAEIALDLEVRRETFAERNVVGVVRGVGTPEAPELADETIVLSAHFDHVGVLPGRDPATDEEDVIRNGADDDASGTAVLLELAEAFAAGPPPARTVVFLFCAAEEAGMWGTTYWVENPTVPLERVVANLNFEMLGRPDELLERPGQAWLTGHERTNLGERLAELGVVVHADPRPQLRLFQRSDNIVFVREGIVGQTLSTGGDNPNYHRVTDEVDTLDFDHLTGCAELALRAARALADGSVTPEWREGEPDLSRR